MPKDKHDKTVEADIRCRHWLAKATDAREAGKKAVAERCEEKAQFWLDRWNKLLGND
jgi:hypothetical protein